MWDGSELNMDLSKILSNKSINMNIKGKTKDEVLSELVDMLYEQECIHDKELFISDVYEREKLGVTGIGQGIAIPHGKSDSVVKTGIVIGRSDHEIQWESLDGEPVHMVILFAVRNDDRETMHVKLLSKIARVLGNDDLTKSIMTSETKEEILSIFINNQ